MMANRISAQPCTPGQENITRYYLTLNYIPGFTYTAFEKVANLTAHTQSVELILAKQTLGDKDWHRSYGYPRPALIFYYVDLGLPKLTGQVYAILPTIISPLHTWKSTHLDLNIATGVGYFTKVFDPKTNTKNKAISTRLNMALQFNFQLTHKIGSRFEANLGLGLTHFSNGSFKLPNNGINVPGLMLGATYKIKGNCPPGFVEVQRKEFKRKDFFQAYMAYGRKAEGGFGEKKFNQAVLSLNYGWFLSRKSKLSFGLDEFYDPSMPYVINDSTNTKPDFKDKSQTGLRVDYEFVLGRLGVIGSAGFYLHNPKTKIDGRLYQRVGLKYNIHRGLFTGISLKTHQGRADFIEWIVGVTF